jgi:hypothetical protein
LILFTITVFIIAPQDAFLPANIMPKGDSSIRVEIVEISCSGFARWLGKENKI